MFSYMHTAELCLPLTSHFSKPPFCELSKHG